MPILFCNIGWMEHYKGLNSGDDIRGGGAHVRREGRGNEICNFSPHYGSLYGYVQPVGEQIKIEKLGVKRSDEQIEGVTVVWTAHRPGVGTVVVGWYLDATVYRYPQPFVTQPALQAKNDVDSFRIKALAKNAILLPLDARTFRIPRRQAGGMGQSNVWFASGKESAKLVADIRTWIETGERKKPNAAGKRSHAQDQERKSAVEKAAVAACWDYYERLGYTLDSVEEDNQGWDLEASSDAASLRIEVKGLSGKKFSIGLTPNEYRAFKDKKPDYRLAVVVDALGKKPRLTICRYSSEQANWIVEGDDSRILKIATMESAMIHCA